MREIFLEEAQEVLETARTALHGLESAPGDLGELTTLRRAFHTLKGSSRMVGLREFGEAAWVCEQAYNTRLAEAAGDDQPLIAFTGWALGHFAEWVDDIVHRRDADRKAAPVAEAAKSFSGGSAPIKLESQSIDRRRSSALPDVDASAVSAERVQELLSTIDLSFDERPTPSADRAVQELDPSVLDVDALPDLSFGEPTDGTAQEPVSLDPMGVDSLEFDLPVGELEFLDFAEQPAESSQAPHSVPASPGGSDDPDWLNSDHPLMHDVFGTVATEPLPLDSKYGALPSDDLEDGESIEMIEIDLVDFSESGLAQELGPQEHADQSLSQGDGTK